MLVNTIYGEMDDSLLVKNEYIAEDTESHTMNIVEYTLNGEIVHRAPTLNLKAGVFSEIMAATLK